MALQLRKHGIKRVRPLLGGFYAWKELGYPLIDPEELLVSAPPITPRLATEGSA